MEVLLSDAAIIIYEIVVIAVMSFFIRKIGKEKKEIEAMKIDEDAKKQQDMLSRQLANENRR